ncbi:ABC transporter ATP-binding protein [Paenibacillus sp. GSMTC-2017]|uniref:ABC transporter ATP-binding protein n=1 Tax=Paenibacillus sp. GSMTC-2017 TaxID=2794350 RepID=UPI0018D9FBAF|nr:ABC transporter ATP-binding protein [Paenibacillus sp. GSMTC-2017]MBH5316293.1 ABC transporter ATP-binding protein [Paenibacillus sp. GSMTC-2017]
MSRTVGPLNMNDYQIPPPSDQAPNSIPLKQKLKAVTLLFNTFFPIVVRVIPLHLLGLTVLKVISALVPIAQIYLVKETIDSITALFMDKSVELTYCFQLLGLQALLYLADKLLQYADQMLTMRAQQQLRYYFQLLLLKKTSQLPLFHFDNAEYYNKIERTTAGMDTRGFNVFSALMTIVRNGISVTGIFYILLSFHWVLAVAVMCMLIPNLWINAKAGQLRFTQMFMQTQEQRQLSYIQQLLQGRNTAKEIRMFESAPYLIQKWKGIFQKVTKEKLTLEAQNVRRSMFLDLSHTFLNIGVYVILVWYGFIGSLTIGHYVSLSQALTQMQMLISGIGRSMAAIYEDSLYVTDVLHFLEMELETTEDHKESFPELLQHSIQIDGLSFTYSGQSDPTLQNINLTIKPGEKVSIVGDNGAGKSTLVKCILGLYLPTEGSISFDGTDIRTIRPSSMRRHMAVVFQDFVGYNLSARENIALGQLEHIEDDTRIQVAAAQAGAVELLTRLPQGLDTELGVIFNRGYELSGGQWQKIAISRAYMRDAQLVILDEPTASLDPIAEAEIYDNFAKLCEGKTTIMISHRLSSCRHSDRIVVMRDGSVVEQGTHEELIDLGGRYKEMFELQAKRYLA